MHSSSSECLTLTAELLEVRSHLQRTQELLEDAQRVSNERDQIISNLQANVEHLNQQIGQGNATNLRLNSELAALDSCNVDLRSRNYELTSEVERLNTHLDVWVENAAHSWKKCSQTTAGREAPWFTPPTSPYLQGKAVEPGDGHEAHLQLSSFANLHDQYRIIRLLGCGAQGAVYHMADRCTGAQFAVKVVVTVNDFDRSLSENEIFMTRQAQNSPYAVRMRDAFARRDSEGTITATAIILELAKCDLEAVIKDSLWSPQQLKSLAKDLIQGLKSLNEAGVIHQDIKPANVLLNFHNEPPFSDFGLAAALKEDGTAEHKGGTEGYEAPELQNSGGCHASVRTDTYSLGIMLVEILDAHGVDNPELRALATRMHSFCPIDRPSLDEVQDHLQF